MAARDSSVTSATCTRLVTVCCLRECNQGRVRTNTGSTRLFQSLPIAAPSLRELLVLNVRLHGEDQCAEAL